MTEPVAYNVLRQAEAARMVLAQYADILGEDAQAKTDMIEGETSLVEAVTAALARIAEIDALEVGLKQILQNAKSRLDRLQAQRDLLRTSIGTALEVAEEGKLETPLATVSVKKIPAKVEIIDETLIPDRFWTRQDPTLNRKAIGDALKAKEEVPGAVMGNGGSTIQIVTK